MTTELSHKLKQKQAELSKRISAIEADFKKGRSADFAEQTTERENDEVLDEIHHEAKQELSLVNQALERIDSGNYGICQQCEEPIKPERLAALPYTTTCIECAQ
ncbi:TraR/DksA family transcriptional regulator [Thalassotalea sediminis]|uniref:TraR/DksA family transcriptional regulator n=1 Tax=Thalassotalea sediminis TaxID=1759089 RepID=UPI00330619D1